MTARSRPSVWILQHVPREGPGLFGQWLADDGIPTTTLRLFDRGVLPRSIASCRGLVIAGGPMNVDEAGRYPWLAEEIRLIQRAIAERRAVLGICLGAQLIAKAAGARVWHGPTPEVGWCQVEGAEASREDPLFAAFPARYTVFQWHGDTFDLPQGAALLARSRAYPHQAFRLEPHVYALQYHLEVTPAIIQQWLNQEDPLLRGVNVSAIRAQTAEHAPTLEVLARQLYSCWRTLLP